MPRSFGFKDSQELPGYLKLEKARVNYRKKIKTSSLEKLFQRG